MKDFTTKSKEKSRGKFFWISLFLFFMIWSILSRWIAYRYHPMILPSPFEVLQVMFTFLSQKIFWQSIGITLYRGFIGLVLAVVLGILLGFFMGELSEVENFFRPLMITLQTTPTVSWLALALIWFRLPSNMTIFITFIAIFPLMTINVYQGMGELDPSLQEMATLFQVSKKKQLFSLYLPQLLPFIWAGGKAGIGMTWKAVVMAELLSGRDGVGGRMALARVNLSTAEVFAWTGVLMILGYVGEQMMQYIGKKTIRYWGDEL